MSDIVFIADFFAEEIGGGGELNNQELIQLLSQQGHNVPNLSLILRNTGYVSAPYYHSMVAHYCDPSS